MRATRRWIPAGCFIFFAGMLADRVIGILVLRWLASRKVRPGKQFWVRRWNTSELAWMQTNK
jgi:hypothetical protein